MVRIESCNADFQRLIAEPHQRGEKRELLQKSAREVLELVPQLKETFETGVKNNKTEFSEMWRNYKKRTLMKDPESPPSPVNSVDGDIQASNLSDEEDDEEYTKGTGYRICAVETIAPILDKAASLQQQALDFGRDLAANQRELVENQRDLTENQRNLTENQRNLTENQKNLINQAGAMIVMARSLMNRYEYSGSCCYCEPFTHLRALT
jgi:5-methylthioribose kinase